MAPSEAWIMIDGHFDNVKMEWEIARQICFNVAAYGNSDPRKFPRSARRFMPFDWDEKGSKPVASNSILQQHERMKARREELERKQKEKQS